MEITNEIDYIGKIGDNYNIVNEIYEDKKGIKFVVKGDILYVAKISNNGYNLKNEIEINIIIRTIKSPNIVKFIESGKDIIEVEDETKIKEYIIFEHCSKGALFRYLDISRGFNEIVAMIIFKQILEAVEKIHSKGIYQLNLKTENILIDSDYNIKIGDFGDSKRKKEGKEEKEEKNENKSGEGISLGNKGKLYPLDPKTYLLIKNKKNDPFSDITSYCDSKEDTFDLGLILFNLLTGIDRFNKQLYKGKYLKEIKRYYLKYIPEKFKKLFLEMLSFDLKDRPSIPVILNNDLFKDIKSITKEEEKSLIKKELEVIENKINDCISYNKIMKEESVKEKIFVGTTKIRNIRDENILENYIKIKGALNPIDFMNKFSNEMDEIFDIKVNKNYLKFNIIIEKNENEKEEEEEKIEDNNKIEDDLSIIIELLKIRDNEFALNFIKGNGTLRDFYQHLKKIMQYAKE